MSWFFAALGFCILIVFHELGHFAVAKWVGMRVERFALFFPPIIAKRKIGETEYGIGAIPLGGFVKITGMSPLEDIPEEHLDRAYYRQPVWKRIAVILAGPVVNILIAFIVLFLIFSIHGVEKPSNKVAAIEESSPAAGVLHVGDRIISVDGKTGSQTTLRNEIASHHCKGPQVEGCHAVQPVTLVVERDKHELMFKVDPVYDASIKRVRVGFDFGYDRDRQGPLQAAGSSVKQMWLVTSRSITTIALIFEPRYRHQISGVVGSYEVTRQAVALNFTVAMYILALISLSLGIINLFPFLPLDGGHIFWALVEKIRGKPVSVKVMERAGIAGFALVIGLFVLGLSNDLGRIFGGGFHLQ